MVSLTLIEINFCFFFCFMFLVIENPMLKISEYFHFSRSVVFIFVIFYFLIGIQYSVSGKYWQYVSIVPELRETPRNNNGIYFSTFHWEQQFHLHIFGMPRFLDGGS